MCYNERECEYDNYGDTRNNIKNNEEKYYSKHSYSYKDSLRIKYIKDKKENQREELDLNNKEIINEEENKVKKNKKRKIKEIDEEDENYGNNYEKIAERPKKKKNPKKGRVRF